MTIYVEYAVLDNMVIDLLILNLTRFALKIKTKKLNIFLSAVLGTVMALVSPILPFWVNLITKILLALFMTYIAFVPKNFKSFLLQLFTFLLITFAFSGACFGVFSLLNLDYSNNSAIYYSAEIPLGLILLIVTMLFYVCKNLLFQFYKKRTIENFTYDAQISSNNHKISIKAFLDTGNDIVDKTNFKPVILINYNLFSKLYPEISIENLILKKIDKIPLKNAHYIDVLSISSQSSKILVFTADNLQIFSGKVLNINNINVGLSLNYQKNFACDCILSPSVFGE